MSATAGEGLLQRVEDYLTASGMRPTKFGRLAAHDPRFVLDLRAGRRPRAATEQRILHYIAANAAGSA